MPDRERDPRRARAPADAHARLLIVLMAGGLALMAPPLSSEPASYREGMQPFLTEMVARHGLDPQRLGVLLETATYRQEIIDAMERPYEAKPWRDYRALFLTPERIEGGLAFWRQHRSLLERARAEYGVNPEIIVAILGVETNYGANLGRHRVIDALTTLGFSYPRRASFFRGELESLLLLGQEEGIDLTSVLGSYAGAMGQPQFIASSYRAYAVDFDGDGHRDLWTSVADVIGSVANYLAKKGWRRGQPIAFAATLEGAPAAALQIAEKAPLAPETRSERLRAAGVRWDAPLPPEALATLIRLDGTDDEYWIGLENFYVITRYNHSNLYAMAVHQLGEEILRRHRDPERLQEPIQGGSVD